jgi:hypothetical protein
MTAAERAANGGYTVATREKLRALWLNFTWAGPSEKIDAARSFDALWAEQSSTLAVKKVAEVIEPFIVRAMGDYGDGEYTTEEAARAIVAEFGPLVVEAGKPAVDREALARIFMEHRVVLESGTTWLCRTCHQRWNPSLTDDMPFAEIDLHPFDMAVASGFVLDAAEVRREQQERDARIAEKAYSGTKAAEYIERGIIAAAIREQKPWA